MYISFGGPNDAYDYGLKLQRVISICWASLRTIHMRRSYSDENGAPDYDPIKTFSSYYELALKLILDYSRLFDSDLLCLNIK